MVDGNITYRNKPKLTEKLVGPHNEKRLSSKNYMYMYKRRNNGKGKEKRKTENDVTGLDDERRLQQVEGVSRQPSTDISSTTLRLQTFRLQIFRLL